MTFSFFGNKKLFLKCFDHSHRIRFVEFVEMSDNSSLMPNLLQSNHVFKFWNRKSSEFDGPVKRTVPTAAWSTEVSQYFFYGYQMREKLTSIAVEPRPTLVRSYHTIKFVVNRANTASILTTAVSYPSGHFNSKPVGHVMCLLFSKISRTFNPRLAPYRGFCQMFRIQQSQLAVQKVRCHSYFCDHNEIR